MKAMKLAVALLLVSFVALACDAKPLCVGGICIGQPSEVSGEAGARVDSGVTNAGGHKTSIKSIGASSSGRVKGCGTNVSRGKAGTASVDTRAGSADTANAESSAVQQGC